MKSQPETPQEKKLKIGDEHLYLAQQEYQVEFVKFIYGGEFASTRN